MPPITKAELTALLAQPAGSLTLIDLSRIEDASHRITSASFRAGAITLAELRDLLP